MAGGRSEAPAASVRDLVEWLQTIARALEALDGWPVYEAVVQAAAISRGCAPQSAADGSPLASPPRVAAMCASPAEFIASVQRMRERFIAEAATGVQWRWAQGHSAITSEGRPPDPEAPAVTWRVRRFLAIIEARWRGPALSAALVAAELGVTQAWMSRIVKEQTGRGFLSHVDAYRLPAATQLLLETTASEKEIAAAVGYSSRGQFSARFKARYGVTPGAYRERLPAPRYAHAAPPDTNA